MNKIITAAMAALWLMSCQKTQVDHNPEPARGSATLIAPMRQTGSYKWQNFTVYYYVGVPYRSYDMEGPGLTSYAGTWDCVSGNRKCAYNVTTDWRVGTPTGPNDGTAFDRLIPYMSESNGRHGAIVWADNGNYYILHMRGAANEDADVFTYGGYLEQPTTPIIFPEDGYPHMIAAGTYRVVHTITDRATFAISIIPADSVKAAPDATIK